MSNYGVDDDINLTGAFWVPGKKRQLFTAEVRNKGGKHFLYESAHYRRLKEADVSEAGRNLNSREAVQIPVLLGQTNKRQCSLMHLQESGSRGVVDFSSGFVLEGGNWRISALVMGIHLKSSTENVLDGFALYLSDLDRWISPPWQHHVSSDTELYELPNALHDFFNFCDIHSKTQVTFQGYMGRVSERSKLIVKPILRLLVKSSSKISLDYVMDQIPRISSFFTLMLGTSVTVTKVQLFKGRQDAYVVRPSLLKRQKTNFQSWVRCTAEQMAYALATWIAIPDSEQMVEKTVLGMLRISKLYTETEFLALAQSLEAFGRIHFKTQLISPQLLKAGMKAIKKTMEVNWGSSEITRKCMDSLANINEPTFSQRIESSLSLLTPRLVERLVGDRKAFSQQVRQTRNFYTHLGIKRGGNVVSGGKDMFLLNVKLHAVLRALVLVKLSLPEASFEEAVVYESKRWF